MLKYFSVTPPENSGGAENSTENSGPHAKTFFALCTNLVYDIRSGYRKLASILVTVCLHLLLGNETISESHFSILLHILPLEEYKG